jgi:hypothetical protein
MLIKPCPLALVHPHAGFVLTGEMPEVRGCPSRLDLFRDGLTIRSEPLLLVMKQSDCMQHKFVHSPIWAAVDIVLYLRCKVGWQVDFHEASVTPPAESRRRPDALRQG